VSQLLFGVDEELSDGRICLAGIEGSSSEDK